MYPMTLSIIYISILAISFLCSLVSFRLHRQIHLKLFSVLLGIALITEVIANYFLSTFHLKSNWPVYNVYILLQGCIYAFYFRIVMPTKTMKKATSIFIFLFFIFWLLTTFLQFGLREWNSYVFIVCDLFIIIMSAIYLYKIFTSEELIRLRICPEFWIAVGSVIYFSCDLPITGMMNFTSQDNDNGLLLREVLQYLNIIMYAIFIYAYLCLIIKTRTTKSHLQQ